MSNLNGPAAADAQAAKARAELLEDALSVGASITADSVGCSITEATGNGFRTPAASSLVAMELDLAQYEYDDGPCVAACRDGQSHSITVMGDEPSYAGFTAVAVARGIRSSLSLPLTGPDRASALNLYASSGSAFESEHARAVADLLARCVSLILPGPTTLTLQTAPGIIADRDLAERARRALEVEHGLSPGEAFHRMTELSRSRHCSVFTVSREILSQSGPTL